MAAHRRPHAVLRRWATTALAIITAAGAGAQTGGSATPYDRLSAVQQRLLLAAAHPRSASDRVTARDRYNNWPDASRACYEKVTAYLASLALVDPENGEVLGTALDLVESVDAATVDAGAAAHLGAMRLAVRLTAGARDLLRRSAEFDVESASAVPAYWHAGNASVRIALTSATSALILFYP